MTQALGVYDKENRIIYLSEALDRANVVFQLAHVLCLIELRDPLNKLTESTKSNPGTSLARCHIELANYFAAAFLMPYEPFLREAELTAYDIDRLAARFGVSFEQTCHRLTTLQRPSAQGVPFFFLRVDKAGNVTKRFNPTSFHLAEYGGACPVWKVHMAFRLAPLHHQPHRRSSYSQLRRAGSPARYFSWLRAEIREEARLRGCL